MQRHTANEIQGNQVSSLARIWPFPHSLFQFFFKSPCPPGGFSTALGRQQGKAGSPRARTSCVLDPGMDQHRPALKLL